MKTEKEKQEFDIRKHRRDSSYESYMYTVNAHLRSYGMNINVDVFDEGYLHTSIKTNCCGMHDAEISIGVSPKTLEEAFRAINDFILLEQSREEK